MFLTAMGLGLGTYVDQSGTDSLGGVSYLVFLAPGLLAATAMQSASFEATFPIMGGLVWNKIFHAMYATPISPRDIALGNLALDRDAADAHLLDLHPRHRPVRRRGIIGRSCSRSRPRS